MESPKFALAETAKSWRHFVELVNETKKRFAAKDDIWYRGHEQGHFSLTPSLFRFKEAEEKESLLCDLYEKTKLGDFGHSSASWGTVFSMQHYGIPTRLLDWTNALGIAVFFAVTKNRKRPCIYILDPIRLNSLSTLESIPCVPREEWFDFGKYFGKSAPDPYEHPVAIIPTDQNPRMQRQSGCFTAHGSNRDPLEWQAPDCIARIELTEQACAEAEDFIRHANLNAYSVFPDHEGAAQFAVLGTNLQRITYDEGIASIIRRSLQNLANDNREALLTKRPARGLPSVGLSLSNLDEGSWIPMAKKNKDEIISWLKEGPPFLFVTGKAGIGKTNFILYCLLSDEAFAARPSVFYSLKLYGAGFFQRKPPAERDVLVPGIYDLVVGPKASDHQKEVARKMISEGDIFLALDGLDELARLKSGNVAESVMRELDWLIGDSKKARIIISCRDHILERLKGTGAVKRAAAGKPVVIRPFKKANVKSALEGHGFGKKGKIPDRLIEFAKTPLFYEMIRHVPEHEPDLIKASTNRGLLLQKWFEIMLRKSGCRKAMPKISEIAARMLELRTDFQNMEDLSPDLATLVEKLSARPFVLFVQELENKYSFSHQSLREFVLAWAVAEEIKRGRFKFLRANPSFDYEGAEFHARLNDLLSPRFETYIVDKLEAYLRIDLSRLKKRSTWRKWNNLARNLFEIVGELMPDDDRLAAKVIPISLRFLARGKDYARHASFKTKYNVARALERIHPSAPRLPYFDHILNYHWSRRRPDRDHIGAQAVRGFHMVKQQPSPYSPTVFVANLPAKRAPVPDEAEVSNTLLEAIEALDETELPEDAILFGINCTHALIRWLPYRPDLSRIKRLLKLPQTSAIMKENLFWALFRRYGIKIDRRFSGLFNEVQLHYACDQAKRSLERLRS